MALMLFAALALVCLITGNLLFYALGSAVQGFLLGVFGVYAFFFLIDIAHLGLRLILRRPVISGNALKVYSVIRIAVVFLFAILHLAISANLTLSLGEQISSAYYGGLEGYASTTVFGVIGALLIAPVITVASTFGTYLLYSIILLACVVYLLRAPVLKLFGKVTKSDKQAKPKRKKKINFGDEEEGGADYEYEEPERNYGFFFNEEGGFAKKSRRELNSGSKNGDYIFEGDFEKKTDELSKGKPPKHRPVTPIEYTDEGKIDLRKRKDSVGDLGQNYPRQGTVSKVIPREPVFVEGDDERSSAQDARVYVVPMSNEKPVSTPNGSSVSSTLYDKAERKVPPTPEEGDKKPPFKVVVSPFGEDPKPKPVGGYYDDVTEDFTFSDRSPASAEPISPEEKPTMKDLPEFDDGMRVRHTEVQSFEKTEPNIRV